MATNGEVMRMVPQRRRRAVSKSDRGRFLEAVAGGATVTDAAVLSGHPRSVFYSLRDRDEEFARLWADAVEAGTDVLEAEAVRRAVEGWDEAVFGKGPDGHVIQVGTVKKYSDRLLEKLLAGRRPMYRDNPRVAVQVGTQVEVAVDRSASLEDTYSCMVEMGLDPKELLAGSLLRAQESGRADRALVAFAEFVAKGQPALPEGDVVEAEAVEVGE